MNRRIFLGLGATTALVGIGAALARASTSSDEKFEISLSEEEWRERLTDQQFAVLRKESTERAFTSPLNDEKRKGTFHCAGCDLALYSSETKFDSGTGWPSFYEALPDAVATKTDFKMIAPRTEVHCRRCGGHLGHVFNDGPQPTGKRHCINGVALEFKPATSA